MDDLDDEDDSELDSDEDDDLDDEDLDDDDEDDDDDEGMGPEDVAAEIQKLRETQAQVCTGALGDAQGQRALAAWHGSQAV